MLVDGHCIFDVCCCAPYLPVMRLEQNKQTNKQSRRLDKDSKAESMLFAFGGMPANVAFCFVLFFKTPILEVTKIYLNRCRATIF